MPTEEELKEQTRQIIYELRYAMKGDPGNPQDNGLVGDVKDLAELFRKQNSRVRENSNKINKIWGILIGVGVIGSTSLGIGIQRLIGG